LSNSGVPTREPNDAKIQDFGFGQGLLAGFYVHGNEHYFSIKDEKFLG
jgi:hypothetical protein